MLAAKDGSIADLVVITADTTAPRLAFAQMRSLGVSQLVVATTTEPPLAAKEVSGAVSELPLMDKAFRDPSVLDRPVGEVMEPRAADGRHRRDRHRRRRATGVVHRGARARRRPPVGVLTRSDVLAFLADRDPA